MSNCVSDEFGLYDYDDEAKMNFSDFSLLNSNESNRCLAEVNHNNSSENNRIFLINNYDFLRSKRKEINEKTKRKPWSIEEVSF